MLTMTSLTVYGKHVTKGWLTFSSPLNDEWLKKCIFLLDKRYCQQSEILSVGFFQLSVGQLSRGWWGEECGGVGNNNIISINKEFVDRLDGKLPFLITEIWGENIHKNVWYRC